MGKAIFLRSEARDTWMVPMAFGVAIAVVYCGAWPGAWLYDDAQAIVRNGSLREAATAFFPPVNGSPVAGRPLLNASFAVDWAMGGVRPGVYLATNIFIHWLAVCTLWGVLRRTCAVGRPGGGSASWKRRPRRFTGPESGEGAASTFPRLGAPGARLLGVAVALAWAVHPLGSTAVAYVSQRAESLAALTCLFALYSLGRGWRGAAVVACAAGMAVKETMVAAPLILWLYDGAFLAPSPGAALRRSPGFYLGLVGTWVVLAVLVLHEGSRNGTAGFGSGVSALRYAALQGAAILHYLRLAAWPHPLVFLYPRTLALSAWDAAADVMCLALLGASIGAYIRGPRGAGFLGLAFFLWLAPSSSFLPISTEIRAEHRMYLPLAALLTLVAAAIARWTTSKSAPPRHELSSEGVISLGRSSCTSARLASKNACTVPMSRAAPAPDVRDGRESQQAATASGLVSRSPLRGPFAVAAAWMCRWFSSPRLSESEPNPEFHHAGDSGSHGDTKTGPSLEGPPIDGRGQAGRSNGRAERGNEFNPGQPQEESPQMGSDPPGRQRQLLSTVAAAAVIAAWGVMARVRARDFSDPVRLWTQNARVAPTNPLVWNNLGTSRLDAGDSSGALLSLDRAIAIQPDYAEGHLNRGLALVALDRMSEAAAEFEAALRLSPGYDKARQNAGQAWLLLGNRAAQSGRSDEALLDFTRSVAANPADPYAENNLGLALRRHGRIDEAIAHYRRALALKPDFAQARTNLNVALALQLRR